LTAEIATPLFAAVATDTGWFRFSSVSGNTYRIAARLVDAGASPQEIYRQLYEQDTVGRARLRGIILSRVVCELDGRLGHTYALQEDFQRAGAVAGDTEEVINMVLAIAGVEFAVLFVQLTNDRVKISFRSRCDVDCSQFAEQFGGGGHKAAAGATVQGIFAEIQPRVLDRLRAAMQC
jgi:phosphoesterase RecJ-like protein